MNEKPPIIRSVGETDAGSAGTQLVRDSRLEWMIQCPGAARDAVPFFQKANRSFLMPSENPLAEGKVFWLRCLLIRIVRCPIHAEPIQNCDSHTQKCRSDE
jgi:hypothetical protein